MALGVALGADIAGPRQVRFSICRKAHRSDCRSSRLGSLARASYTLRGRPRLRRFGFAAFELRRRLLPRLDRRRIPRDVLDKMASPSSAQSTSHADGSQDGSRQTRKRPAKTSPRSEAGRHRSSRTAGKACRQPQDARSGRASSECRTPPWL